MRVEAVSLHRGGEGAPPAPPDGGGDQRGAAQRVVGGDAVGPDPLLPVRRAATQWSDYLSRQDRACCRVIDMLFNVHLITHITDAEWPPMAMVAGEFLITLAQTNFDSGDLALAVIPMASVCKLNSAGDQLQV